ncbi:XkdX family protein [Staphylococcus simiae]|uniref:XkdX family protein n=1 Tax=Staphylococcus simiae CCM 7213 = CCUG 51256 TaxID=911238 RepID=G5JHA1_9STAP|nr:XkdX family protein [Staphylococcus simiae]EHJ08449.1 hypothetical protein SS7213T_04150 [Staphylococcus simiae CCM 7213 = CCUG 51256]PNZ12552.1 XkdX family protein [Staphylococcus simiae]SNV67505.1 phage protein [Staphylococcus simiae]
MWPRYEDIEYFYKVNAYTNDDIALFVEYGALTKEEYKKMTGEDYKEPRV